MSEQPTKAAKKRKRKQPPSPLQANYQEIPVARIRGNHWNPRGSGFDGPRFDELAASIRQKGVLQPIVVRPISEQDYDYEIIAGERRHRAVTFLASQDPSCTTIPAIIRDCDDEEAFEICCIENLQRQDLSEPEEASAFAEYVDRKGQEGVTILAEKLGLSPRYVRKRVEIMRLPKPLLWAWRKEILQYGHLEQFLRIAQKKERLRMLKTIIHAWRSGEDIPSVRDFRQEIDEASADLARALFEKTGCVGCAYNSETQRNLFGIEDERARCLDNRCYTTKQKAWLTTNWKDHLHHTDPGLNTNGIRFSDDVPPMECEPFYYRNIDERCLSCESFITLLFPNGNIRSHRACVGRRECRKEVSNSRNPVGAASKRSAAAQDSSRGSDETEKENGAPVKSWHGEYFREEFFKTRIPEKLKELDPLAEKMLRLSLFALVVSNSAIHPWLAKWLDLAKKPRDTEYGFFLSCKDIFPAIETLGSDQMHSLLQEATIEIVLNNRSVLATTRRSVADYLGIDLATEWRITKAYLEKKTKNEIVSIINRFNVLDQPRAWKFAVESCGVKFKSAVGKLRKEQLMGIFLGSGIDLAGIVPAEILRDPRDSGIQGFPTDPPRAIADCYPPQESVQNVEHYTPPSMEDACNEDPGYTPDPEDETAMSEVIA